MGKEVDGKRVAGYLWSGRRLVGVLNGSGVLEETFVWGTRGNVPDEMVAHGQVYRILADARGSVRLVVDAGTGQVMQALRYSPWGRVIGDTDPGFQPFGYAGGLDDRRTGLERFGVRDYDPATGRWIEPDPILFAGGGTNLYAYTDDDPVDEVDPLGLFGWPSLPQGVVDYSAGFGDTLSFGLTNAIRNGMGTNGVVNKCSNSYSAGQWSGVALDAALGGAAGLEAAGANAGKAGFEFSHWIPNRFGGPRSLYNGNYVSQEFHYLTDPFRFPPGWQQYGDKLPTLLQQLGRISWVYPGAAAGGAAGAASAASQSCGCQQ